tara:strand:- start:1276 stop:1488 length:213 start_codon:yes stop_codon:yes gene_type:complete
MKPRMKRRFLSKADYLVYVKNAIIKPKTDPKWGKNNSAVFTVDWRVNDRKVVEYIEVDVEVCNYFTRAIR